MDFQSASTLVLRPCDNVGREDRYSTPGRQSPLDFLAQASMVVETQTTATKWSTTLSDGREKITVVPGPSGHSIRLHKGNGRLPPIDLSKPFAKKCRNRECNNLGGQPGKPRSIYCSKRCQSREQNLRQGRIKNVRSPNALTTGTPPITPRDGQDSSRESRSRSVSPHSSPESEKDRSSSPEMEVAASSPSVSPLPFDPSVSFTNNPPSPSGGLSTPSPIPPPFSTNSMMPPTHTLAPSPLTVRLGMTPSPIEMSPSPMEMRYTSSFSPVPMCGAPPANAHLSTPIFIPKPAPVHRESLKKEFAAPAAPSQPKQEKNVALQSTSFFPPTNQNPKSPSISTTEENLTLAPILS